MNKYLKILITLLITSSSMFVRGNDEHQTLNSDNRFFNHLIKNSSLGLDQLYYSFEGTKPADGNIYAFDQVILNMQLFTLKYQTSPLLSYSLVASHINNYAETYFSNVLYKDRTTGLGDTLAKATKTFILPKNHILVLEGGVSLPTGSINKKNANAPQLNYPYNMQLGSGTFDLQLSSIFIKSIKTKHQIGLLALGKLRTGTNNNSYRLGNEYLGSLWYSYLFSSYLTPMLKFSFKNNQGISGVDPLIGRNIYLEFYYNPRDYWDLTFSLNSKAKLTDHLSLQGLVALPLYQGFNNIDNVEVEAKWYAMLGLVYQ